MSSSTNNNGKDNNNLIDITVVSVFHDTGFNPLRKMATLKAVGHWMMQSHLPSEFLFVELGFDGMFTFSQDDFPSEIHYLRIDGTAKNKYLFQKECMWNFAAKMAMNEKLMFVDSDVSPLTDQDWFKRIYDVLDECIFTQGFRTIQYLDQNDNPTYLRKLSFTSTYLTNGEVSHANGVPGGVYCIRKSTLQQIGYFNYTVSGCGDNLFWSEILDCITANCMTTLFRREYVQFVMMSLQWTKGIDLLKGVDVEICHFYHGPFENRSYEQRDYMWLTQYPWFGRILQIDGHGLMAWTDTRHYFYKVMSQFHNICDNKSIVHEMMKEHLDYIQFVKDFKQMKVGQMREKESIVNILQYIISKHTVNCALLNDAEMVNTST